MSDKQFPPLTRDKLIELLLRYAKPNDIILVPASEHALYPFGSDGLAKATQIANYGGDMIIISDDDENY